MLFDYFNNPLRVGDTIIYHNSWKGLEEKIITSIEGEDLILKYDTGWTKVDPKACINKTILEKTNKTLSLDPKEHSMYFI